MIVIHGTEVFEELVQISFQFALDNEGLAQKFLDACVDTFQFLAANRKIGKITDFGNPLLQEVRMWRVKGFDNYLIFYQPISEGVKILHIVHGARNYELLFGDA